MNNVNLIMTFMKPNQNVIVKEPDFNEEIKEIHDVDYQYIYDFTQNLRDLYCVIEVNNVNYFQKKIVYQLKLISSDYRSIKGMYNNYYLDLSKSKKKENYVESLLYQYSNNYTIVQFLRKRYFSNYVDPLIGKCLKVLDKNNIQVPQSLKQSIRVSKYF